MTDSIPQSRSGKIRLLRKLAKEAALPFPSDSAYMKAVRYAVLEVLPPANPRWRRRQGSDGRLNDSDARAALEAYGDVLVNRVRKFVETSDAHNVLLAAVENPWGLGLAAEEKAITDQLLGERAPGEHLTVFHRAIQTLVLRTRRGFGVEHKEFPRLVARLAYVVKNPPGLVRVEGLISDDGKELARSIVEWVEEGKSGGVAVEDFVDKALPRLIDLRFLRSAVETGPQDDLGTVAIRTLTAIETGVTVVDRHQLVVLAAAIGRLVPPSDPEMSLVFQSLGRLVKAVPHVKAGEWVTAVAIRAAYLPEEAPLVQHDPASWGVTGLRHAVSGLAGQPNFRFPQGGEAGKATDVSFNRAWRSGGLAPREQAQLTAAVLTAEPNMSVKAVPAVLGRRMSTVWAFSGERLGQILAGVDSGPGERLMSREGRIAVLDAAAGGDVGPYLLVAGLQAVVDSRMLTQEQISSSTEVSDIRVIRSLGAVYEGTGVTLGDYGRAVSMPLTTSGGIDLSAVSGRLETADPSLDPDEYLFPSSGADLVG